MRDHLGRGLGIVLIAMAAILGAYPPASAQWDVDRMVKKALDGWKEGTPAARESALEALGALGRDARPAIPLLIGALRDANPVIRGKAALAIGQIGSAEEESIPALTALLADPEISVRDAAATAIEQLGRRAEGAIGGLVRSLRAEPERRCLAAALALVNIGLPALPALIDLLKADDPSVRQVMLAVTVQARPSLARAMGPHLAALARDPQPGIRAALATTMLAEPVDSPERSWVLRLLIHDSDLSVRMAVLARLQETGQLPADLRGEILDLLKDGDGGVRAAAARAIPNQDLASSLVIDRLLAVLQDPVADVRAAAAARLAEARSENSEWEAPGRLSLVVRTSSGLARSASAGPILRSALSDADPHVRALAAHLLPAFPAQAAEIVALLTECLKDPSPEVRAAAAGALFRFKAEAGPSVRPLLAILANPNVATQEDLLACMNAARTLAVIGGEARSKMYRVLLSRLNSLDGQVRERAALLLNPMGNRHLAVLLGTLADPKSPQVVRVEIVGLLNSAVQNQGLSALSSKPLRPEVVAAIPMLRSMARSAVPGVRVHAFALLGEIEPESPEVSEIYRNLVRSRLNGNEAQWLPLAIKPAMIPGLVKGLDDKDVKVRLAMVSALTDLASSLHERESQETDDSEIKRPAADRAGERAGTDRMKVRAAVALLGSLRDPDDRIRWRAAEALGFLHVESKAVVPALTQMVNAEMRRVPARNLFIRSFRGASPAYYLGVAGRGGDPLQVAAIQGLAGFGPEASAAVPELTRALGDPDPRVRWFAAEALGWIGPEARDSVPVLVAMLGSRDVADGNEGDGDDTMADGPLRLIAAVALGKIGPSARAAIPDLVAALSDPDSRVRAASARALGLIGPAARAAVPELIRLATRGTVTHVARDASEALARLGPVVVPGLIEVLRDGKPAARVAALEILGRLEPKTALPIGEIVRCLDDRALEVRVAAALTLASADRLSEATAALPVLLAALDDLVEGVTEDYTTYLNALGKSAVPALLDRVRDRDPAARAVAIRTLARMGTLRYGFPPELNDRVQERVRAVRAAMRSALGDGDERIRSGATEVFRALGVEVVPDLIATLDDPSPAIRQGVARTLGGMGNDARSAIGPLRKLRDDTDPNGRQAAESAAFAIEQTDHFDSVVVPLER